MKTKLYSFITVFALSCLSLVAQDFDISNVYVTKDTKLRQIVFTMEVAGLAGDSIPDEVGSLDGASVLGYVFPTSLNSYDVGFDTTTGIVAMALTSHPDFDDTPLWDENNDANYLNDGVVWHAHWVLLENNSAVPGGLAVKALTSTSVLPPTNPGMPMYMDSPGFQVVWYDNKIECAIPYYRMNNRDNFSYDGVTARMQVNTSDPAIPTLGVYEVYDVASGDLSLPYTVGNYSCDTVTINVSAVTGIGLVSPEYVTVHPNPSLDEIHIESSVTSITNLEVQIFDSEGKLVFQKNIEEELTVLSSEIGEVGTYILKLIDSDTGEVKGSKNLLINK